VRNALPTRHIGWLVTFSEIAFFLEDLGFWEIPTFNSYTDRESARLTGEKLMVTARWGSSC